MVGLGRGLVAAGVAAVVLVTTVAVAGATAPRAKSPTWKVGDCYATADVDHDEVDLTTKVACTKEHDVQVLAGAKLPSPLGKAEYADLVTPGRSDRIDLVDFATETCTSAAVARSLYPKQAKALVQLFEKHDVEEWVAPVAGRMGWVLPDEASYDAGAKALLCIFEPDGAVTGTTAGDIRKVATSDPLKTLRLCFDFNATNTGTEFRSCDEVHDGESLIWIPLPVTGKPRDVSTWGDAEWAPLDDVCAEFATVLIGAKRADLKFNVDTDPTLGTNNGKRYFNCRTYPLDEAAAFPAGFIATGAGKAKIKFAKT